MADEKDGIKSAYDLAMEKIEQKDGKLADVTEEQKAAIADADSQAKAKIAELEIMIDGKIVQASAIGSIEAVRQMQEDKAREIAKINADAESEKERIRKTET